MFPGSKNKRILLKKIVTSTNNEINKNELENFTYLGDTIEDSVDSEQYEKKSNTLLLVNSDENKTTNKSKKVQTEIQEPFDNKSTIFSYNLDNVKKNKIANLKLKEKQQVVLCTYQIHTKGLKPFISYLLYKNSDLEEPLLYFPFLYYNSQQELDQQINQELKTIINEDAKTEIEGYLKNDDTIYIFIKMDEEKQSDILQNQYIWTLIDEIINKKKVYDIFIHSSVYSLFIRYTNLLLLFDKNENPYESPTVVYSGNQYDLSVFNSVLGLRKSINKIESLGNYYYFYDFVTAKKMAQQLSLSDEKTLDETEIQKITIKDSKTFKKGGIVRYAIFTGKMKVFLQDNLDEILTTESSKKWTENYNSAFIGKLTLQNGEKLEDTPIIVTEKYEQQLPLSLLEVNN